MKKILCVLCLLVAVHMGLRAQTAYVPSQENLRARAEFQDAKFGLFIHWGLYSMMANGEWIMQQQKIPHATYSQQAAGFYPSKFDAAAWVSAAKGAGMKYICLTSRHHDGFSMFDTKYSDYNIVQATPFKRDIIAELAAECHKQGIKLHFYYSHLDWSRPDYLPFEGHFTGVEQTGKWSDYLDFMNNQLTELLTKYGPIGAIWFDGWWDKKEAGDWQLDRQYALIHRLQPACLIGNNHHQAPKSGEDFQMFERDLPGHNTAGHSAGSTIGSLPLESCETMNGMWGYKMTDMNYKSANDLIRFLVRSAGYDANLLLNIGPQANGEIPDIALDRMQEIGAWMSRYGETIYGTRGGPVSPRGWGVTTCKGDKVYVHILDWDDSSLFLPLTGVRVRGATIFGGGEVVGFKESSDGVLLSGLPVGGDSVDLVVELTVARATPK